MHSPSLLTHLICGTYRISESGSDRNDGMEIVAINGKERGECVHIEAITSGVSPGPAISSAKPVPVSAIYISRYPIST